MNEAGAGATSPAYAPTAAAAATAAPRALHARTTDVPEAQRFEYFRDALSDVYLGIRTEWSGPGDFDASFDAYPLEGAVLAGMRAPGHIGRRGDALVRHRPDEAVYINVSASGDHRVGHLGRRWTLARGMPILLDSEAPFVVDFAERSRFQLSSLRIEKDSAFAPGRREMLRANERLHTTGAGHALAAQMRLLCAEVAAGRPEVAAMMAEPIRALLLVLIGAPAESPRRLDELKALARARIGHVGLRADHIGEPVGVTGRTVQSEFRRAGETFAGWLRAERLDLAWERLASPAWRGRTIAAVSASCGFADPAHFHRAFRERFGVTPGDIRPAPLARPDARA